MREKEFYKEEIIEMVQNINSIWLLEQIFSFIKNMTT